MFRKFIDKTGRRYGNLFVVERVENYPSKVARFLCRCDCGNEKIINSSDLSELKFRTVSCGCVKFMNQRIKKLIHDDLSGKKIGRLLVIEEIMEKFSYKKGHVYRCKCDCGNLCEVVANSLYLKVTKSCGCLRAEKSKERILEVNKNKRKEITKMGIYWYAYSAEKNEYFSSPSDYKGYGSIKPNNPFPGMVLMKNMRGYNFELVNDVSWEHPDGAIDITAEVYKEYLELFPWAKEYYERD